MNNHPPNAHRIGLEPPMHRDLNHHDPHDAPTIDALDRLGHADRARTPDDLGARIFEATRGRLTEAPIRIDRSPWWRINLRAGGVMGGLVGLAACVALGVIVLGPSSNPTSAPPHPHAHTTTPGSGPIVAEHTTDDLDDDLYALAIVFDAFDQSPIDQPFANDAQPVDASAWAPADDATWLVDTLGETL